jgi:hypothetical protein
MNVYDLVAMKRVMTMSLSHSRTKIPTDIVGGKVTGESPERLIIAGT